MSGEKREKREVGSPKRNMVINELQDTQGRGVWGLIANLLIVLSWDVPAHKPFFVSFFQNRAFGQSRLFDWGSISDVLASSNSGQMTFQKD